VIEIRPLGVEDASAWRLLWRGYLGFYETELPEEIYRTAFARLTDPAEADYHGLIAMLEGVPVGLAHFIFHRHGWQIEEVCYLQDLFVAPEARGFGVGRALVTAVFDAADAAGRPNVYWLTQEHNSSARRLYDRIGRATRFIKYQR
jgi:GNAT superfamily N-acetyltransferase